MSTKKTNYNKIGIEKLPDDKRVVYQIETEDGKPNYIGTAKKGRVKERLQEHLGEIPGATVKVQQFDSIDAARKEESRLIEKKQPKDNEKGK